MAATHTPGAITARRRGRPLGSVQAVTKKSTTIRFDADVLEALKATGPGWQTRVNGGAGVVEIGADLGVFRLSQ